MSVASPVAWPDIQDHEGGRPTFAQVGRDALLPEEGRQYREAQAGHAAAAQVLEVLPQVLHSTLRGTQSGPYSATVTKLYL